MLAASPFVTEARDESKSLKPAGTSRRLPENREPARRPRGSDTLEGHGCPGSGGRKGAQPVSGPILRLEPRRSNLRCLSVGPATRAGPWRTRLRIGLLRSFRTSTRKYPPFTSKPAPAGLFKSPKPSRPRRSGSSASPRPVRPSRGSSSKRALRERHCNLPCARTSWISLRAKSPGQ